MKAAETRIDPSPVSQASTSSPLFGWLDWSAFWFTFLVVLGIYSYTVAPSVTLEDSGELATAGAFLGVAHPPGYPLWTFTSWIFTKIFASVTYMGQPNPAWSIALASAFFGALAAGITGMLLCRSAKDLLAGLADDASVPISSGLESLMCWVGGVGGSLFFAFSPCNWSQSVIVEIYSLNAFFLALVMILAYAWLKHPTDKMLVWLSLGFGLGLTNYQGLLLILPAFLILVMVKDLELFRDFLIVGVLFVVVYLLTSIPLHQIPFPDGHTVSQPLLPPVIHPTDPTCFVYMCLNFVMLVFVYFLLPRGKTVALCVLALEVGLAFYGFMPFASETNPPMNWAYPRTWEGFKHAITRGQYEKLSPTDVFSAKFVQQVFEYMSDLRNQFTLPVAILGFVPFAAWRFGRDKGAYKMIYVATGLAVAAGGLIVLEEFMNADGIPLLTGIYKFIIVGIVIAMAIGFLLMCLRQAGESLKELLEGPASLRILLALGTAAVSLLLIVVAYKHMGPLTVPNDPSSPHEPTRALAASVFLAMLAIALLCVLPLGERLFKWLGSPRSELIDRISIAPILTLIVGMIPLVDFKLLEKYQLLGQADGGGTAQVGLLALILLPLVVPLAIWLMHGDLKLRTTVNITSIRWIIVTVTAFLWMSIVFMVLANPKGDLQDAFIQRVKFISSDQLFSFWIAYGIVVGIFCVRLLVGKGLAVPASVLALALSVALPMYENYRNEKLVWEVGGAEQNGHDFGWQFGNYELRGAKAITEELAKDEEPLPDPSYPDEMGPDAIFYGGTDPGRFVPTYMIYSAKVREDVDLITQNALADQTYMNVMRDLYGDRIWIPAQMDSAEAFHRYVDEVQKGIRPPNADLKIEGGRVQVSGALGVMEINGILAQMIFEHNRYCHSFYVEESYVIGWMYPYLTPHGLIMKINHDQTDLTVDNKRQDMDFWDWYRRRLMGNVKFRRDVVARKSFSKLRSAIAGLYANRRSFDEAEDAFHEARILYPLSPEANFRLAQEVLVQQRRFDYAIEVLQNFGEMDPGQDGVRAFTNQLATFSQATRRIEEIENRNKNGGVSIDETMELLRLYKQSGRVQECDMVAGQLIDNTNTPPQLLFELAQTELELRNRDKAIQAANRVTSLLPPNIDPQVYHQLSSLFGALGEFQKAQLLLNRFLQTNPQQWEPWLEMAALELQMGHQPEAWKSAEQALLRSQGPAQEAIMNTPQFEPLRANLYQWQQRLQSLSGSGPMNSLLR